MNNTSVAEVLRLCLCWLYIHVFMFLKDSFSFFLFLANIYPPQSKPNETHEYSKADLHLELHNNIKIMKFVQK